MRIVMGMIVKNRFEELKKNLYHNSQFFDEVIVVSDSSTEEMNAWLTSEEAKRLGIKAILDFDGYQTIRLRQRYLDAAAKEGWMMRLDVDEYLSFEGGYQLRGIAQEAEDNNINMIGFRACDVIENLDGSVRVAHPEFWCPNFFKLTPNIRYVGEHHEGIDLGVSQRQANVNFYYYHVRSEASIKLRGARNAFSTPFTTSGAGNQAVWQDFRSRCSVHGITEFHQLAQMMRDGTVPEDIVEWFILHRNSDNCEYRSYFEVYFVLLHPEKNTACMGNVDFPNYDPDRQPYLKELTF